LSFSKSSRAFALWTIQEYGRVDGRHAERRRAVSYERFIDYDVCGARLSRMALDRLRRLVSARSDGLKAKAQSAGRFDSQGSKRSGLPSAKLASSSKLNAGGRPGFRPRACESGARAEEFAARFAAAVPKVDKPPSE